MLLIFEIAHLNFTQHYTDSGEEIQFKKLFNHCYFQNENTNNQ